MLTCGAPSESGDSVRLDLATLPDLGKNPGTQRKRKR